MKPIVGVWDQWCVASDKPYIKMATLDDGTEIEQTSLLDAESCRQIVRNFGLSKDDLPCTLGHQHTTVDKAQYKTATYSALAYWRSGQVDTFAAHGNIQRPAETDLPHADNGQRPEDGIYAFRQTVTDLGEAIVTKRAVRKTSPEFVMDGRNQQNESIGPQALGLAWTDDPFLNGCEINLERFPQMRKFSKGTQMPTYQVMQNGVEVLSTTNGKDVLDYINDVGASRRIGATQYLKDGVPMSGPDLYKLRVTGGTMNYYEAEAGVEEKDSPEIKFGKLKSHFGRKAMMEAGIQDADSPDVALGKFAKHMECHEAEGEAARKMEGSKRRMETEGEGEGSRHVGEAEAEAGRKHGMEGPAVHAGAPTMVDPGKPSEKVVGGHAMESGDETKQAMSHAIKHQRAEMERMKAQLAKFEADRALTEANKAIDAAWSAGRLVPLHSGETEAQTKARFLKKYQTNKQLFEADLAPAGTHAVAGSLTMRLTSNGLPFNFERDGSSLDIGNRRPDEEIIARAQDLQAKHKGMTNAQAAKRVCMENPHLDQAYTLQAKRAAAGLA